LTLLAGIAIGASENYTLQTLAGDGLPTGMPALSANLGQIDGVAVDGAGNIYMSLVEYSVVVRMDTSGILTVVAGNGTRGFSGDNGPANVAQLNEPQGLAVDAAGNLYIADFLNSRIRRVSNGIITTFAGSTDNSQGGGDNGPATSAGLFLPAGIAFDTSGNLYIAELGHNRIRKVSNGIITTVAGTGSFGVSSGDGGPATLAALYDPIRVAVDAAGNIYIAQQGDGRIREVSNGIISTFVGPSPISLSSVFLDSTGSVYAVTQYQVSKFTGFTWTLVAGKFLSGTFSGDGGPATGANLAQALDATIDVSGNIYIADSGAACIRKITNGIIQTVAGHGTGGDGPAISAELPSPGGVAVDPSGNIYMADASGNRIDKISNGVFTTVAGIGTPGFSGDGGPATAAQLNGPSAVAIDAAGSLYISDQLNQRIRKVSNGMITTVAGNGEEDYNGDNKSATDATLCYPNSIAADASGSFYFIDSCNYRVRKVTDGVITTIAGNGTSGDSGDNGPATSAQVSNQPGIAIDASGDVYLVAYAGLRVRRISNGIVTTVAGTGNYGFSGDGGPALSAEFENVQSVAVDSIGNLYIADGGAMRIRKVVNGMIASIAGDGSPDTLFGGVGLVFGSALNLALDAGGNVYFSDSIQRRLREASCVIAADVSSAQFTKFGGTLVINILGPSGCAWNVAGLPSWLTVSGAGSGIAPGNLTLIAAPNTDSPRNATFSISAASVSVTQTDAGCTYVIDPSGQAFPAAGVTGSIAVTAEVGCLWTATTAPDWMFISSGSAGIGNGSVDYQLSPNVGADRSATLLVAGLSFDIEQQAGSIPGLALIGSLPHVVAEENWSTTFTLVNKGAAAVQARFSLFDDSGAPLQTPLIFPQLQISNGPLLGASIDRALPAYASLIIGTGGPQTPPVLVGSAQLAATGAVDGFAIFHQVVSLQEAVVPLETRIASSYVLSFDNTNGLVLGVALQNVSAQDAVIGVVIRDETGMQISAPGTSISLPGSGHSSFGLSDQFPVTANTRGTIEFDTPAGGQISVLGLRFTPPNNALTTIPALANVGTGGGSIAHLASGGDGWQTTFVLVNTGTTAAPATLSFFADMTGAPLSLPLSFPQAAGGATMTVPSYTAQLAAGATLIVISSGAPQLLTGSAQLSTTGHVSGFVIFRHNNQEAVVPLESRNANAYVLAFDNTNGIFTGVAVNNASAQAASVPVTVRDDTGAQIATDTLNLNPNGHVAFTLVTDKYPATANIRGTIEFDNPPNGQIGALGIRIPPTTTYTTLPALAK
jgi:sugar lactone lactonase YvrE